MRKQKLLTIVAVLVLLLPSVLATDIQYSTDNITWTDITNVDETNKSGYQANLHPATKYYFRGKDSATSYSYLSTRTKSGGENLMASLAVTLFILLIPIGLFFLAFYKERFSQNQILDFVLRKSCIVGGLFLLILASTMMVSISNVGGLGLSKSLYFYTWLFSRTVYVVIVIMIFRTIVETVKLFKMKKEKERMGDDEE